MHPYTSVHISIRLFHFNNLFQYNLVAMETQVFMYQHMTLISHNIPDHPGLSRMPGQEGEE